MPSRLFCAVGVALALLLGLLNDPLWAQGGSLVRQCNLNELTHRAAVIIHGQVVSAVVEPHPNLRHLPTVVVTMRVSETLKGAVPSPFTFREFLWRARTGGVPLQYRPGSELLLMMNKPSEYGLSSPVALEQGTFRIVWDSKGQAMAVNGRNNRHLFAGTPEALGARFAALSSESARVVRAARPGPIRLNTLSEVVRRLAEVQ